MIKPRGEPDAAAVLQPRLPFPLGDQQLSRRGHRRAGRTSGCSRRCSPGGSIRCRCIRLGNPDLKETSVDAYELGYSGVVAHGRAIVVGGVLRQQDHERHPVHGRYDRALHLGQPAAGLAAAAAAIELFAGGVSGAVHLPELRQDHQQGDRARRHRHDEPVRRACSPITRSRPTPKSISRSARRTCRRRTASTSASTVNRGRYRGDVNVAYTDSAFWQDVLDDSATTARPTPTRCSTAASA